MTDVRPFRGVRFDPEVVGDWGAVLGPPYDIITRAQAAALKRRHPNQIVHIESAGNEAEAVQAAALFAEWRGSGVLLQDPKPAYYVAEHAFEHEGRTRTRTTLYGAVRLTPWDEGEVLPHEWTMPGPKEERTRLRRMVGADVSPLMSLVPDGDGRIMSILQVAVQRPADASGTDYNGDQHTLWLIDAADEVEALRQVLAANTVYMADGHHRYEAALEHRDAWAAGAGGDRSGDDPENFVLMGLVMANDEGLELGGTHRVVHVAPAEGAVERLSASFTVQDLGSRRTGLGADYLLKAISAIRDDGPTIGALGLNGDRLHVLLSGAATREAMPASAPVSWSGLDAALLQYVVLEPVFGIDAEAREAGEAVTYTHDANAAWQTVIDGNATVAFFLSAPGVDQIVAAADAGDRMPQKSTYFTPKLPTGLVLHTFDDGGDG